EGLKYYVGVGASAYITSYDGIFDNNWNSATFGVQGYAGFEYTFEDLPINLTIDWVPTYFLGEGFITGFRANYGTLGVRYVLGRGN
ncbi:MAG: hypothetical protein KDD63_16380, partial [Bacteroidetes bacterium]|nr:hypothetical protein [Bacteroidota bacterium]